MPLNVWLIWPYKGHQVVAGWRQQVEPYKQPHRLLPVKSDEWWQHNLLHKWLAGLVLAVLHKHSKRPQEALKSHHWVKLQGLLRHLWQVVWLAQGWQHQRRNL
jgi:hypothetical protein